jgi:hypothetical protein
MKNQFDELAKAMAQSVTRRTALKRFGIGLGLVSLSALGLTNTAEAAQGSNGNDKGGLPGLGEPCKGGRKCAPGLVCRYGQITGYQHICLY